MSDDDGGEHCTEIKKQARNNTFVFILVFQREKEKWSVKMSCLHVSRNDSPYLSIMK